MKDYYEILQVSPNAEPVVIASAYRRLARKYHPDAYAGPDATERMRELNEAYEVLSDPARRAEYDRARRYEKQEGRRAEGETPPKPPPREQDPVPPQSAKTTAARSARRRAILLALGLLGLAVLGVGIAIGVVVAVDVAREGDDTSPGGVTSGFPQTPSSADDAVGLPTRAPTPINTPSATVPQQVVTPTWTIYELSRAGQVEIVLEDGLNAYTLAVIDPETYEHWDIAFVTDVNADDVDDAIVSRFTGGAHCCFEYLIFREAPEGIHLDDWFSIGNATVTDVVDLDGDGIPELQTRDDRLAYFPDLCYACSPFLPLVLCRSAQAAYYDCTPQFPQLLESSAQEFEGQLRKAIQEQLGEYETRSSALGLLASYLRMDYSPELVEKGWSSVESLCPECEDWLLQNSSDLMDRLRLVQPYRSE